MLLLAFFSSSHRVASSRLQRQVDKSTTEQQITQKTKAPGLQVYTIKQLVPPRFFSTLKRNYNDNKRKRKRRKENDNKDDIKIVGVF